jgi:hypothetical protein
MKHLIPSLALLWPFLLAGTAAACDHIAHPSDPPIGSPANDPETQSHTPLFLEPAATDLLRQTKTFLDDTGAEVDDELSRMRTEGQLDRRSMSRLQGALDNARGSMDRIVAGTQGGEPVDLWTARIMAYELGMAADTLSQQAHDMETGLGSGPDGATSPSEGRSRDPDPRRHLARTLITTGDLLRESALTIARNLK